DMQSGSPAFGTPESAMGIVASAQMARHYKLPFRGGGALTSSKSPDAQAAYESLMCMWPTVLGGVHFVLHAAGWLESALLASYEKFIIDVEALRMFEWILSRGIPFDDEGFAMDGIREVGPGGHHLGSEHTMRHYRTGFYRPWISSTENFDRWQRNGSRTACRFAIDTVETYRNLQLDGEPVYWEVGSLEVAATPERWEELKRKHGHATSWGLKTRLIGPDEISRLVPIMRTDHLYGAIHV